MTRIASHFRYCASCHQQKIDEPHIDFEAYYDGPTVGKDGAGNYQVIDDLVICETCLRGAAQLLGYVQAEDLKVENKELGELIDQKDIQLRHKDQVIANQADTIQQLLRSPAVAPERKEQAKAAPPPHFDRAPSIRIKTAA